MIGRFRVSPAALATTVLCAAAAFVCPAAPGADGPPLAKLDNLLLHTKYEAAEALAKTARAKHPKSAPLLVRAAELHAARGRYARAIDDLKAALKHDYKSLDARVRLAELLTLTGKRDEAARQADSIIDFYNADPGAVTGPRELVAVGLALKLVNAPKDAIRVLTRAQRADKSAHPATIELGRLFLLKGQVTDASKEFNRALRGAKDHPAALLGLAECHFSAGELKEAEQYARRALESAPNAVDAFDLLAAMAAIDDDYDAADEHLQKSLAVNPNGIRAHAIRAGTFLARADEATFKEEEALVAKINPRCADFYTVVGRACTRKRRMQFAERMFRTAIKLDAKAHVAMAELGQHLFRRAKYDEAKELLERSHRIDGYNVRTYNTLELLDDMGTYPEAKVGDRLVVKLDGEKDRLLTEYVREHALRSLAELERTYDHKLGQPVVVEVLPTQRYFAARCVGLPHIGAIGVCFGRVVALTSPRVQRGRINWRETLRHELTHAINLLGTNYRIPHWLTEAMAVHEQGADRPYKWDVLLVTSARLGRILPISKLTRGFTRPESREQRMLAYCQSEIVLDFVLKEHGDEALPALMKQFRQGKELAGAIEAVTGRPLAEFETACMAYIHGVADAIPVLPHVGPRDVKQIEAAAKNKTDAAAQCNLAILRIARRKWAAALAAAKRALKADPHCAEAHYLIARIRMTEGKKKEAVAAAAAAVRCDDRYTPAHYFLGGLAAKEGETDRAIDHLRRAIRGNPRFPGAYKALAKICRGQGDEAKAAAVYEGLIEHTSDSLAECIELCRYYEERASWADVARVADVAIGIGPFFAEPHAAAGRALWELGRTDRAVCEMEMAGACAGRSIQEMEAMARRLAQAGRDRQAKAVAKKLQEARERAAENDVRLARAHLEQGDRAKAKAAATAAFDADPNNEEARALLQRLR
ncbi:MAG: tetratricopeptide repeat protein [Planctomycetota bacterium]